MIFSCSTFGSTQYIEESAAKDDTLYVCTNISVLIAEGKGRIKNDVLSFDNNHEVVQIVISGNENGMDTPNITLTKWIDDQEIFSTSTYNTRHSDYRWRWFDEDAEFGKFSFRFTIYKFEDEGVYDGGITLPDFEFDTKIECIAADSF